MEENLAIRKDIRLRGYDYSNSGFYFITICTHLRKNLLCNVVVGRGLCSCRLRDAGDISQTELFGLMTDTIRVTIPTFYSYTRIEISC